MMKILEDKPIRASDIASGKLILRKRAASGAVLPAGVPRKQRVNIYLDSVVVEHFKTQAGERGYQTLINEALKNSILNAATEKTIEKTIRHTIQQELKAYKIG
jgi:uncharacterized protein (DUF4415 family)